MTDAIGAALIGGILGIVGGAIAALVSFKTQKPISEANAAKMIQEGAADLVEQYRAENKELRAEIETMRVELSDIRGEFEDLRIGVGILTAQLVRHGHTPEWKPRISSANVEQAETPPVKHGFKR